MMTNQSDENFDTSDYPYELGNEFIFGCEISWIDGTVEGCAFLDEMCDCTCPGASQYAIDPEKFSNSASEAIPTYELAQCPNVTDSEQKKAKLESPFLRIRENDTLTPIVGGIVIHEKRHHIQNPDRLELDIYRLLHPKK
jgi:hypothetical protein